MEDKSGSTANLNQPYDEVRDKVKKIEKVIDRINELESRSNKEVNDRVQQGKRDSVHAVSIV